MQISGGKRPYCLSYTFDSSANVNDVNCTIQMNFFSRLESLLMVISTDDNLYRREKMLPRELDRPVIHVH